MLPDSRSFVSRASTIMMRKRQAQSSACRPRGRGAGRRADWGRTSMRASTRACCSWRAPTLLTWGWPAMSTSRRRRAVTKRGTHGKGGRRPHPVVRVRHVHRVRLLQVIRQDGEIRSSAPRVPRARARQPAASRWVVGCGGGGGAEERGPPLRPSEESFWFWRNADPPRAWEAAAGPRARETAAAAVRARSMAPAAGQRRRRGDAAAAGNADLCRRMGSLRGRTSSYEHRRRRAVLGVVQCSSHCQLKEPRRTTTRPERFSPIQTVLNEIDICNGY